MHIEVPFAIVSAGVSLVVEHCSIDAADAVYLQNKMCMAHSVLRVRLAAIATATSGPVPDRSAFAETRWRLTKASRERWILLQVRIMPALRRSLPDRSDLVERLEADAVRHQSQAALHMGRWPLHAAIADWPAYCPASRVIQIQMRARIDDEAVTLLPALSELARRWCRPGDELDSRSYFTNEPVKKNFIL